MAHDSDDVKWFGRRERTAVAMLCIVMAGGTLGFMVTERWGIWDSLYMTLTTVTTVGAEHVSRYGQMLRSVLILCGVGTALYASSVLLGLIIDGRLYEQLDRRRRSRMIDELSGHFILCGFGRIGQIVANEFIHHKVAFVVIEKDPEQCHEALERGLLAVAADSANEEVLKKVGIARAKGLIAAVGTDAQNVYTVLSARLLNPQLFIVSRAEAEDSKRRMQRAGADRVLSPYHIGAIQLAQTALRPAVVDFVQLATSSSNLDLNMEQVPIAAGTALDGQSILEANLRQAYGVIVIGIQRADGRMEFNPSPEMKMAGGDFLVVLGRSESLRSLEATAVQTRPARA